MTSALRHVRCVNVRPGALRGRYRAVSLVRLPQASARLRPYDAERDRAMSVAKRPRTIARHAHLSSPHAERTVMGMLQPSGHWTAERVRALPDDGNRYELIDGRLLVTPAPRGLHQVAIRELMRRLDSWVRTSQGADLLFSPADISLGEDEVLQPDLFVYRTAAGTALRDWSDIASLLLVIEVLSPSTARYDRDLKRRRYQRAGVPEYWIVDADARVIERWRSLDNRPEIVTDGLLWEPDGEPTLTLDVAAYFAAVWGE